LNCRFLESERKEPDFDPLRGRDHFQKLLAELETSVALVRKGVELGKGGKWREWTLLALGMAEYRSGNYAAAKAGPNNPQMTDIAAFYRALSLFRQGKEKEARQLALAAAAKMKPLPKDDQNPLAN
jgi:hypothetical protein